MGSGYSKIVAPTVARWRGASIGSWRSSLLSRARGLRTKVGEHFPGAGVRFATVTEFFVRRNFRHRTQRFQSHRLQHRGLDDRVDRRICRAEFSTCKVKFTANYEESLERIGGTFGD